MRDRRPKHPVRLGMIAALCVAAATPAAADATVVRDAAGRSVTITDTRRIVSIGGAVTEILYALGLEDRIVAVDSTSAFPPRAQTDKPSVGYMRQLSPEGVLGLSPSLVLAIDGAGPNGTLAVLESAVVPFVQVPDHFTGPGIIEKIELIARATGTFARGECLAALVERDLAVLAAIRKRIEQPRRILFILSFLNGRPMVAGRATAAEGIITLAGARNVVTEFEGYKLVNDESVIAARPDAVLAMERAGFHLDNRAVLTHPAFATTAAAARNAFFSMESLYLLGFGPRTARAARDLALLLYPELGQAPMPSDGREAEESCRR
ncbi:MAG: ABC transporter substrate-binding protein [Hyphomicrobiales bacterium]|nr:ABC transporter substrate-binding protein [Hyphomicrobiales bacterium]